MIWVNPDAPDIPYLVAHETAHQWFYSLVGSDQAKEPFADEAPTDFLARNLLGMRRKPTCAADMLDKTVYDYADPCYYETIYIAGGNYINSYRLKVGDTAFWRGMRSYLSKYRFGMAARANSGPRWTRQAATPAAMRIVSPATRAASHARGMMQTDYRFA